MTTNIKYSYTVLRYIHDTTSGEFINVGVAIFAPSVGYANIICRKTVGRLSCVFPNLNARHFRRSMKEVQLNFKKFASLLGTQLPFEEHNSVMSIAIHVLPKDDSSLQWANPGSGITLNPENTLNKIYDRMVMRYESNSVREHRTEEDVWRHFKLTLEANHLLRYFESKTIRVEDDEVEFHHTWKNGKLHCLEPVSFDLSTAESIRDKAHKWLGRVTSVSKSSDEFSLYFLVGKPQDDDLLNAYESALSILKKSPLTKQIFQEQQTDELSNYIAEQILIHESNQTQSSPEINVLLKN